ncbi:hypothetical protein [Actinocatenispora rupis]|uniref:Uncharacterized protein n=1 Tax=Actinocatenispora rupis TaxID=519421 RepID=A0A8J3JEJ1_9ACTN|nr:hypothetical protein [Actinocatenispora rupis]GID15012.1 hypothetical protein Aru02nite_59010 [Actinocatenispora rupis]
MDLPLASGHLAELCGDRRTVPALTNGVHLHTGDTTRLDDDPYLREVHNRPPLPQITPLSFGPGAQGSQLAEGFLRRHPVESLDLMALVPLRTLDGAMDLAALGDRADRHRLPAQVPVEQLGPDGADVPLAQHRVVPLDADGRTTTPDRAAMVRVVPRSSRAAGAYEGVGPEVAALWAARPYMWGHVVFGPDAVNLGWPAGLATFWFGPAMSRFGRPLTRADVDAADGTGTDITGYVELLYRVESAPPGSQGLVEADDHVFLAHRGDNGVAFLDPGTGRAAAFPLDPDRLRLTPLPDTMSLDERFDALNLARFGPRTEPSWPIVWPPTAERYQPENAAEPVVVLGPVDREPPTVRDRVAGAAAATGQPVILLGTDSAGAPPAGDRIDQLGSLLEQYGWRGRVPVVVTRAGVGPDAPTTAALHDVLDRYGASLVHQVTDRTTATGSGGLVSFLGNPWTVREANAPADARRPPVADSITPDLLQFAAGDRRRPAYPAPPEPVATFLTTPLTRPGLDLAHAPVRTLAPLVRQIAARDPSFAGHDAAVRLADLGHADTVTSYLNDVAGGGDTLFAPLLDAGGADAADRQQSIRTLLPHLSALAGGDVGDHASRAILAALDDILALPPGSADADAFRARIWAYKDYLPDDGKVRVGWQRRLTALKTQLPDEYDADVTMVTLAIMTCPEPSSGATT